MKISIFFLCCICFSSVTFASLPEREFFGKTTDGKICSVNPYRTSNGVNGYIVKINDQFLSFISNENFNDEYTTYDIKEFSENKLLVGWKTNHHYEVSYGLKTLSFNDKASTKHFTYSENGFQKRSRQPEQNETILGSLVYIFLRRWGDIEEVKIEINCLDIM
jgi:hypothetical protein